MPSGMRLNTSDIGGAKVFRTFKTGNHQYQKGEVVPAEVLRLIPRANLNALIDQRFIDPMLQSNSGEEIKKLQAELADKDQLIEELNKKVEILGCATAKFVVRRQDLKYDVVRGVLLNQEGLSKADADALQAK